ncbi:hypothetical protein [Aequorivita antarctica]|uniref:Uncharacterized protein n=1 Tax=Aequorivita antarctica TaxID=153266 RepID=A0A5C6Z3D5_9FLAO|nr:hypothetical protein [Aequorivita antarctica]TXD73921.1 hypothetical protein ESU54_05475 [Aequorivita antarctica]SRX73359.1 hypothetical protein AEQU3_00795 [Aequorivita antarctica]
MRVILYRDSSDRDFERYVDLEFFQKDYNTLCIHWGDDKTYDEWFARFLEEDITSQMQTLHFLFLKYRESKDGLESYNGTIISRIFCKNNTIISDFISKWFYDELIDFEELDLDWKNLEDEISQRIESVDGSIIALEFEDGSAIQFLDGDDTLEAVYIEEYRYDSLVKEMAEIIKIFKKDNYTKL